MTRSGAVCTLPTDGYYVALFMGGGQLSLGFHAYTARGLRTAAAEPPKGHCPHRD